VSDRPLLLVDIDGVLNPYAAITCPDGYKEYGVFPEDDQPMRLATSHGEWLRELGDAFDVVWASGWGFDAHRALSPILEIPELPWVPFPPIPFEPAAKVPAVAAYVGERTAAWVDDRLVPAAWEWAESRAVPTLLLPVDPAIGLTRRHVDDLITWAGSLPTD
jgi:hypothetical protein